MKSYFREYLLNIMLKELQFWCITFDEIKLLGKSRGVLSFPFFRDTETRLTMSLKLFPVEKILNTSLARVELARLLVNTEKVLLEIVTCSEGLVAKWAFVVSLIKVNSENVSSNSRFVAERFVTPIATELCVLMYSPYMGLKAIGFVKRSAAIAAAESRV